jgi:hypothetical protein
MVVWDCCGEGTDNVHEIVGELMVGSCCIPFIWFVICASIGEPVGVAATANNERGLFPSLRLALLVVFLIRSTVNVFLLLTGPLRLNLVVDFIPFFWASSESAQTDPLHLSPIDLSSFKKAFVFCKKKKGIR